MVGGTFGIAPTLLRLLLLLLRDKLLLLVDRLMYSDDDKLLPLLLLLLLRLWLKRHWSPWRQVPNPKKEQGFGPKDLGEGAPPDWRPGLLWATTAAADCDWLLLASVSSDDTPVAVVLGPLLVVSGSDAFFSLSPASLANADMLIDF